MNNLIKSITSTVLFASISTFALAQSAPNAQVIDGNLYTTGNPPVLIANAPEGTVVNGDLVIGNVTIEAPTASVLPDGSLDLDGNGVFDEGVDLASPPIPPVLWMGFGGQTPVESLPDGDWYYSPNLKYVFHWKNFDAETGGWFWIEEFGRNFFIFTEPGRSPSTGFFAYTFVWGSKGPNAAAGAVSLDDPLRGTVSDPSTFVWVFAGNDVTLNVPTPADELKCWIWVFTPHADTGGTTAESFFFKEDAEGNLLTRWGYPDNGNRIKLTGPVGYPNN